MELIITDVTKMESCGNYPVSLASFTISLGSLAIHLKPSKLGTGLAYILFSHTYCTKKKKEFRRGFFCCSKIKRTPRINSGHLPFFPKCIPGLFVCLFQVKRVQQNHLKIKHEMGILMPLSSHMAVPTYQCNTVRNAVLDELW